MKLHRTIALFSSGFVVVAVVAAVTTKHDRGVLAAMLNPVPAARADSGSRLKGEYLLGDDKSKDYLLTMAPWITPSNPYLSSHPVTVFWDSMRNEECTFQPASDAKTRCLPIDAAYMYDLYTDPACTQRVVGVPQAAPGCPQAIPKYAYTLDINVVCQLSTGFYPTHIYPVGNLLGGGPQCYAVTNNVCSPTQCGGNNNPTVYYSVGAEVAPASFVASTPTVDP